MQDYSITKGIDYKYNRCCFHIKMLHVLTYQVIIRLTKIHKRRLVVCHYNYLSHGLRSHSYNHSYVTVRMRPQSME